VVLSGLGAGGTREEIGPPETESPRFKLGSVEPWDSANDALPEGSQRDPIPPRPSGNRQAPANPQALDRPQEASNSATPDNPEQGEPDPPEEGEEPSRLKVQEANTNYL
jgi:hypothetical protein